MEPDTHSWKTQIEQKPNISLSQLAESYGLSVNKEFGLSPKAFAQNHRRTRAKDLSANTNKPVQEIAEILGYKNSAPFIESFHSHEGMTPLQWRKHRF